MAQPTYALQVRTLVSIQQPLLYPFTNNLDPGEGGVAIEVTSFQPLPPNVTEADVVARLGIVAGQIRNFSWNKPWTVTANGFLSSPQQFAGQSDWWVNLCCDQRTLNVLAHFVSSDPGLGATFPFASLFPRLRSPPNPAGLGAWNLHFNPGTPLTASQAAASADQFQGLQWAVTLVKDDGAGGVPTVVWGIDAAAAPGLLYCPELYTGAVYQPPEGEQCDQERRRPVGPFPPGPCPPPGGGCGDCCYWPVPGYPSCCFSRQQFPLKR